MGTIPLIPTLIKVDPHHLSRSQVFSKVGEMGPWSNELLTAVLLREARWVPKVNLSILDPGLPYDDYISLNKFNIFEPQFPCSKMEMFILPLPNAPGIWHCSHSAAFLSSGTCNLEFSAPLQGSLLYGSVTVL